MKNKNGQMWYDDQGNPIQAHGGCILEYQGMWYWYGEYKGADNVPGTTRVNAIGISCYSSGNLLDWHDEGLVLSVKKADSNGVFCPEGVCERPKVLYHKGSGKFIMWMHLDDAEYLYAGVGVAVSNSPTGPFTLIKTMQPNRQDSRDMTLFREENGTAWLIHSSNWNKTLDVARLNEDYTDVDGYYTSVLVNQEREAPAVFRHGDMYYMITSGCTGWEPNSALYATSRYLTGQWKLIDNPCVGENYRRTFEGQSSFVFHAHGRDYLMLDHWKPHCLKTSGYSILPIEIENGILTVGWTDYFEP